MTRHSRILLAASAALILLSNGIALSGVIYNRSGQPESRLTLSQRELLLPWNGYGQREDSGLALTLQWRVEERETTGHNPSYGQRGGRPAWLDEQRLAALGIDVERAKGDDRRSARYRETGERPVLVVLELAGPDWERAKERAAAELARRTQLLQEKPATKELQAARKQAEEYLAEEEQKRSRLFAVDAGLDLAALRARYPERERYLILPGKLHLLLRQDKGKGATLSAFLGSLSQEQLHLPHTLGSILGSRPAPAAGEKRPLAFTASIAVGQRLEPWVESLTLP